MKGINLFAIILITIISIPNISYGTEYTTLQDIKKDGKKAVGKEAVLRLKPVAIVTKKVTFVDEDGNYIKVFYKSTQKKKIRRLKRKLFFNVTLEIRSVRDSGEIIFDFVKASER